MNGTFNILKVCNGDLEIRFSCANYGRRIKEAINNLGILHDDESKEQIKSRFTSKGNDVSFVFGNKPLENGMLFHTAYFFENTDYALIISGKDGKSLDSLRVSLSGHAIKPNELKNAIVSDDGRYYATLNFNNQVGLVDFDFDYSIEGVGGTLGFCTEVLSYKMNYRSDMKSIIRDIEREYSMLSYAFLKNTYLSFKTKAGKSSELIWWQIFQSCYNDIIKNTHVIINSPKRRLKTAVRYERADRLRYISPEQENEYVEFQNDPKHLFRSEEMYLSKDTVENRFLKYVIKELYRRFGIIREHIQVQLKADDAKIANNLDVMNRELSTLQNHRFFKGIGQFKGFSQDSLVMKRARGYKDIFKNWVELSCGYELEEGMRKLEVKDISELYEIWCFIKVKNIVKDIMGDLTEVDTTGRELTSGFVRQLVYGSQSEVKLKKENVEVSVMYNAQVEEIDIDDEQTSYPSAIEGTDTLTTVQRPDIVLRLTKQNDDIQYTYLFDAKYRIADARKGGLDVPPVGAINQMHRYRDAIYYTQEGKDNLKREVIGGYVLFPGNVTKEDFSDYYYKNAIDKIGIGAFPLKPGKMIMDKDGNLILDPNSSEQVLREQIEVWLKDSQAKQTLLQRSIPQKGLEYVIERTGTAMDTDLVLVGCLRSKSHRDWVLTNGKYNIRLDMGNDAIEGVIKPTRDFMNASHILLYNEEAKTVDHFFDVQDPINEMPETYGYGKLKELAYPFNVNRNPQTTYEQRVEKKYGQRAYLIYNIETVPVEFQNQQVVDMAALLEKYIDEDTPTGTPFVITMRELMEFFR